MAANKANEQRDQLILVLLGWIPDFALAFVAMKLGDDQWSTFWLVWIAIQVLYLLYWIKVRVWASLVWCLWLRGRTAETALHVLRECQFPRPERREDDITNYLTEIIEDEDQAGQCPPPGSRMARGYSCGQVTQHSECLATGPSMA